MIDLMGQELKIIKTIKLFDTIYPSGILLLLNKKTTF